MVGLFEGNPERFYVVPYKRGYYIEKSFRKTRTVSTKAKPVNHPESPLKCRGRDAHVGE